VALYVAARPVGFGNDSMLGKNVASPACPAALTAKKTRRARRSRGGA